MQLRNIQPLIYEIRGQKIMLDFDLARLYGTETRVLKQAVNRNRQRFPKDFMFPLSKKEWVELITNCDKLTSSLKFSPALPYAFTEHGVTMLASILKTRKAVQMNIAIVRAFIALKDYAFNYREITSQLKELKEITGSHNIQLNQIYEALEGLLDEKGEQKNWTNRERIGFKRLR
ncbi:MAG: ORF6N domain-containing protein [Sphingobacteriales bacterium]|nr:ORF6N domain-containing protein [Sphingobacteriales bacterium]